jgi:hypothetical protein
VALLLTLMSLQSLYGQMPAAELAADEELVGQLTCGFTSAGSIAPTRAQELASWEKQNEIALAPAAKLQLASAYCKAVKAVAEENQIDASALLEASTNVMAQFLTDTVRGQSASLNELVAKKMNVRSPFSAPEIQSLGIVKVIYSQRPDSVRIDKQVLAPWPKFLTETGTRSFVGLAGTRTLCSGTVRVTAVAESTFQC